MADPQPKPDDVFENSELGRKLQSFGKAVAEREAREAAEDRADPSPSTCAVAAWQNQGCAFTLSGTDRAKNVG